MPKTETMTFDYEMIVHVTAEIERVICDNPHDSTEERGIVDISVGGHTIDDISMLHYAALEEIESLDIEPGQPEPELTMDRLARLEAENRELTAKVAELEAQNNDRWKGKRS